MGFSIKNRDHNALSNTQKYMGKTTSEHKARLEIIYTQIHSYRRVQHIIAHHIYNPWVPPIAISDWGSRPDNVCIVVDSPVGYAISH